MVQQLQAADESVNLKYYFTSFTSTTVIFLVKSDEVFVTLFTKFISYKVSFIKMRSVNE